MVKEAHGLEIGKFYRLQNGSIVYIHYICDCEKCQERDWLEPVGYELDSVFTSDGEPSKDWISEYRYDVDYKDIREVDLIEVNQHIEQLIREYRAKIEKEIKEFNKVWSSIMLESTKIKHD